MEENKVNALYEEIARDMESKAKRLLLLAGDPDTPWPVSKNIGNLAGSLLYTVEEIHLLISRKTPYAGEVASYDPPICPGTDLKTIPEEVPPFDTPKEEPECEGGKVEAEPQPDGPSISIEDLRAKLREAIRAKKITTNDMHAVLEKHGVDSLTAFPAAHYGELLALVEG